MRYGRCQCGKRESWTTDSFPLCKVCSECGSTLAEDPSKHREAIRHDPIAEGGEVYCQRCNETLDAAVAIGLLRATLSDRAEEIEELEMENGGLRVTLEGVNNLHAREVAVATRERPSMADETNILKILEDERKQREADKLNDAIRQRIAALTDEQADRFAERLHDLISDTYADPEIDVCSRTRAALVALLAPEAT